MYFIGFIWLDFWLISCFTRKTSLSYLHLDQNGMVETCRCHIMLVGAREKIVKWYFLGVSKTKLINGREVMVEDNLLSQKWGNNFCQVSIPWILFPKLEVSLANSFLSQFVHFVVLGLASYWKWKYQGWPPTSHRWKSAEAGINFDQHAKNVPSNNDFLQAQVIFLTTILTFDFLLLSPIDTWHYYHLKVLSRHSSIC